MSLETLNLTLPPPRIRAGPVECPAAAEPPVGRPSSAIL
jgi:hypothetical protein